MPKKLNPPALAAEPGARAYPTLSASVTFDPTPPAPPAPCPFGPTPGPDAALATHEPTDAYWIVRESDGAIVGQGSATKIDQEANLAARGPGHRLILRPATTRKRVYDLDDPDFVPPAPEYDLSQPGRIGGLPEGAVVAAHGCDPVAVEGGTWTAPAWPEPRLVTVTAPGLADWQGWVTSWAAQRRAAYPDLAEQIGALMKAAAGDPAEAQALIERIAAVKRDIPKG